MMLGVVVAKVGDSWLPVDEELALACAISYPIKTRVYRFRFFFLMVSLAKPLVVELSTWIGVVGCGCPSLRSKVRIGMAYWPLMCATPISALAAEPITLDMIREMEWMGTLRRGRVVGGLDMSVRMSPRK